MKHKSLIERCGAQVVRLAESNIGNQVTELLLNSLGFFKLDKINVSLCDRVRKISFDEAAEIISHMLYVDLAYNCAAEATKDECLEFALYWLSASKSESASYYTNGNWLNFWQEGTGDWSPLTNATFDGGVIEVDDKWSRSIWFQAED